MLLDWFDGRKTYFVALIAVVYLIGADVGWWPLNETILALFGFGGLASLRAGLSKIQRADTPKA